MLETLKVKWQFYKLRTWVNLWFWNRQQYVEWSDRYTPTDEKEELKQHYYLMKHEAAMAKIATDLAYDMHVQKNKWIPLGDGTEFRYVSKNNALHKLERRDASEDIGEAVRTTGTDVVLT